MILIDNDNSELCYESYHNGRCCCNCINSKSCMHEILGFVGRACLLNIGFDKMITADISSDHGICEMHEFVK